MDNKLFNGFTNEQLKMMKILDPSFGVLDYWQRSKIFLFQLLLKELHYRIDSFDEVDLGIDSFADYKALPLLHRKDFTVKYFTEDYQLERITLEEFSLLASSVLSFLEYRVDFVAPGEMNIPQDNTSAIMRLSRSALDLYTVVYILEKDISKASAKFAEIYNKIVQPRPAKRSTLSSDEMLERSAIIDAYTASIVLSSKRQISDVYPNNELEVFNRLKNINKPLPGSDEHMNNLN